MKDSTEKKPPTITNKCGTLTGYQQHCDRFEYPCSDCKVVKSAYNKKHQSIWYSKNGEKKREYRRKYVSENPEKCKESDRKYREAHRQEARDRSAEYRIDYPEKVKATRKTYQEENTEKIRAAQKKFYLENIEKQREYARNYAQENSPAIKIKNAAYRKANPEKRREYFKSNPGLTLRRNSRRRAMRLGNGYEHYTEEQVFALYGTDCHICGGPIDFSAPRRAGIDGWEKGLHIEHVIPMSKGGPDILVNVKPSHGLCNLEKGTK